ncbi:vacuolar protein sorting-associated protein 52 homolog isoform X3 [Rhinoraja longicauda]
MQAVGGEMLMGDLDITCDEFILDEVDTHIQANLEDELVKEALKTGVDLRHYSKHVETELQYIEHASIKDYIKESENIASLHNQITACDTILERMEQMLGTFQSDLSSISCEIQTLQEQSIAMNIKLKNRQSVRSELSQLVDELIVPAIMISTIMDTPVTEQQFLEQLHELNNKINYVKEQSFKETLACADVQDILDRLKIKAVSKIREFILQKIYSFRKPMTNYQVPQNALLKYRFFYQFLMANERQVAKEIRDEYVDTVSKIYLSYFKSYSSRLMKVQAPVVGWVSWACGGVRLAHQTAAV